GRSRDRRGDGRADRRVRLVPRLDDDLEGGHRADPEGPGRGGHRGRRRQHPDRDVRRPLVPPPASDPADLLDAARGGDRAALARLLSIVEQGGDAAHEIGRLTHAHGTDAHTVGITGAPGAGKSTLTSALVGTIRSADGEGSGDRVAVLAIDPSSPFSGGAILGDRVRMGDHATDDGVFIRSMASRGHLGGLAAAAPDAVRVLAAVGYPWVLLETVGVGQVEVEVVEHADTTLVVVNPGW